MTTIDGFDIELWIADTFLFRRVCEPQHEYVVKITSERIEVSETLPADVDSGDRLSIFEDFIDNLDLDSDKPDEEEDKDK